MALFTKRRWLTPALLLSILLGCTTVSSPTQAPPPTSPAPSPTALTTQTLPPILPSPTFNPTDTPVPLPTETPFPSPTPVPPTPTPVPRPGIANRYALKQASNPESFGYDHLAASPGKIWITEAQTGILEIRQPSTGMLIRRLSFLEALARSDPYALVYDMVFDGKRMWILYSPGDAASGVKIAIIKDSDYSLVTTIIMPTFDRYYARLGFSPGKIWLRGLVYEARTQNLLLNDSNILGPAFAYDSQWMWTAGDPPCPSCGNCIVQISNDLQNFRSNDTTLCTIRDQLVFDGSTMWGLAHTNHGFFLDAFDPNHPPLSQDAESDLSIDLNDEITGADNRSYRMIVTGRILWLLDDLEDSIFGHDIRTGRELYHLDVFPPGEENPYPSNYLVDFAYDGADLWALTSFELVRIALP